MVFSKVTGHLQNSQISTPQPVKVTQTNYELALTTLGLKITTVPNMFSRCRLLLPLTTPFASDFSSCSK